jgi:hypothetical protein
MSWMVSLLPVLVCPSNRVGTFDSPVSAKWFMRPSVSHGRRYTPA